MLTDVPGILVGHATDIQNFTGCTVILCPDNTVGSVDVRGPAPGSRETALLGVDKHVQYVNGILLTGGSAFGLAAADGVVRYLEEQGTGHWTPFANVPIVPAAVVYDLFLGEGKRRPDATMGYKASQIAAKGGLVQEGNVGAGTGVTVGKWAGFENMMKGGFGMASERQLLLDSENQLPLIVAACAVTNCVGDVVDKEGSVLAGALAEERNHWLAESVPYRYIPRTPPPELTNTTLVVLATNAKLSKVEVNRLAQRAHDGMAIAIRPAHTTHDGDTAFALATGEIAADFDKIANIAVEIVAEAIRNSVRKAATVGDIQGLGLV